MAEEQTSTITKVNGSTFAGISIRAWLALIVTICVCGNWTANTIMVSLGYTSANIEIPEPIYSVWIAIMGIYYGQVKKQ